jgi:hypothetical protein
LPVKRFFGVERAADGLRAGTAALCHHRPVAPSNGIEKASRICYE